MNANPEKSPRFVVFTGINGGWFWQLRARNGEVVASGEGFTSRKDANRSVTAVTRAGVAIVEKTA